MAKKNPTPVLSLFQRVENQFNENPKLLYIIPLVIAFVFALLLFNLRLDEGGDDSAYINRASDFLQDGRFPSFQGPIYPLFLSLVISIFGIKLPVLKLTSLLFMMLSYFFIIKALKGRVPNLVIFLSVVLLSVNSYVLYFASQTYSEALFMMLQAIFLWRFFRYFDKYPLSSTQTKKELIHLVLLGFLLFLVFQTRTIGLMLTVAAVGYMVFVKRYKQVAVMVTALVLFLGLIKGVEKIYQKDGAPSASQLSTLTYKHPYDLKEGQEDFSGYLMRVVDNSNLYIGKQFLKIIGFKDKTNKEHSVVFTLLFYALFGVGFFYFLRKDEVWLFITIYLFLMLLGTFVSIQKIWDQYRLIIPMVPFMILTICYLLYRVLSSNGFKEMQFVLFGVMGIVTLLVIGGSVKRFEINNTVANLTTNKFQGYTPDWENYLTLAEESYNTLPAGSFIAVRKPDMARIYANGKKFYGIFRFNSDNADELLKQLHDAKVTHFILASLRKNPEENTGEVINTLHRYMGIIQEKYPTVFTQLKVVGGTNEPSALYQINYPSTIK